MTYCFLSSTKIHIYQKFHFESKLSSDYHSLREIIKSKNKNKSSNLLDKNKL